MTEDADVPNRKKRDPILMIGTIVLTLAFVVVISGYAYAQFVSDDGGQAKYGDRVKVDYVGSYYDWYDGEGAVVFDTSLWSVANDDDIAKSYEFTKREERQYVPFNVTIGSAGALKDFENAIIGLSPGDTARIEIPNAYGVLDPSNIKKWDRSGMELDKVQKMLLDEFRLTFGLGTVYPGKYTELQHPYGWTCTATVGSDGFAYVEHHVASGKTYPVGDGDARMTVAVSDGSVSSKFAMEFDFKEEFDGNGNLKLIQFMFEGSKYYVIDADVDFFYTKNLAEREGITLFFVITFVGYQ
ncbi:MAG: FKBP-type peptidyl-prolyl cis-trans isomerase [Methanomassiliicoccaceae archaeon]|nr:FKBP-type peptidyl-prolyl cis-trans isomerase [Methanomassiliicoccaceae archaeon]